MIVVNLASAVPTFYLQLKITESYLLSGSSFISDYYILKVSPYPCIEGVTLKCEPVDEKYVVKTTIDIPDDKWKKFSIKVIEEYGGRKKNDVIEELIDKYLKEKEHVKK